MALEEIDYCELRRLEQAVVSGSGGVRGELSGGGPIVGRIKETPQHPSPSYRAPLGPNSALNALADLGISRPRSSPAKTNKCRRNV